MTLSIQIVSQVIDSILEALNGVTKFSDRCITSATNPTAKLSSFMIMIWDQFSLIMHTAMTSFTNYFGPECCGVYGRVSASLRLLTRISKCSFRWSFVTTTAYSCLLPLATFPDLLRISHVVVHGIFRGL